MVKMLKRVAIFFLILSSQMYQASTGVKVGEAADSSIVIKIRVVNPLDEETETTLHYDLPKGVLPEDILELKTEGDAQAFDRNQVEGEKASFQVLLDEEKKSYFLEKQIKLAPKEILVLNAEIRDIWTLDEEIFQKIEETITKKETAFLSENPSEENAEADFEKKKHTEVFSSLKNEILSQLASLRKSQDENTENQKSVEGHIQAYEKNSHLLKQIQEDLKTLEALEF